MTLAMQEIVEQDVFPPPFVDIATDSKWIREIPGLYEEFCKWEKELPLVRASLERHAQALARPALHPGGFSMIGLTVGRSAVAASKLATDLPKAFVRRLFFGEVGPSVGNLAIERAQDIVKNGGSTMVKLGQFISTAKGLLPDELVESFSWCRDSVAPMDLETIHEILTSEFGADVKDCFLEFDDTPMAAASIGQVHRAVMKDGREVVVKVQRPNLREQFAKDLRGMALLAFATELRLEGARMANLSGFVELFANLVLQEMDFRLEACNMLELGLAAEHADVHFVHFPRPIPGWVTPKVIVMEYLDGVAYSENDWDKVSTDDRERLLRLVISGVLEHTLVYGVFHGDLHAGNVLAKPDGRLALIDYGIVGRLNADERIYLVRFMIGVGMNNTAMQLGALQQFGAIPKECDIEQLAKAMDAEMPLPDKVTQEDLAEQIGMVIRFLAKEGFRLPTPLVLFFKNLLYLNGFAAAVAPGTDLLGEITPIFEYFQSKYPEQMALITSGGTI